MLIRKQFRFEAAHVLPHHPGKCSRLHGHSYTLDVAVSGPLQTEGPAAGMIVDFDTVSHAIKGGVLAELDHRSLNEIIENPTCENILVWIWHRVAPHLPQLTELTLWETATACAVLRRDDPLAQPVGAQMLGLAEIFYSVQGEGTHTGTPAIFVRLAGCNLSCSFCDTDYSLRFMANVDQIVARVRAEGGDCPTIILTGGEPLAQAEAPALIDALRADGRRVHIESNGTIDVTLPADVWLCVSPKERLHPRMAVRANEAKLIVDGRVPDEWLAAFPTSTPVALQPEGNKPANIELALTAIKANPRRLRLSLQTHKFIGVR